jgi:hypothetical protein
MMTALDGLQRLEVACSAAAQKMTPTETLTSDTPLPLGKPMSQSKHRRHGKTRPRPNLKTGRAPHIYLEKDTEEALYDDDQLNPVTLLFAHVLFTRLQKRHGGNRWDDWTDDQINEETAQMIREFKSETTASTVSAA